MFKPLLQGIIITLGFAVVGPAVGQAPPSKLPPTTKQQCFNGGWQFFVSEQNSPVFKNQGDCVSFVATKEKNQPALGTFGSPPPPPPPPPPGS